MNWEGIGGWTDYMDVLEDVVARTPDGGTVVEVGVWLGRSTCYFAEAIKRSGKTIAHFAVDNWAGSGCDGLDQTARQYESEGKSVYDRFLENIAACGVANGVTPVRMDSVEAAKRFDDRSVDFVFVDADHRHAAVLADIRAWLPKVKLGGVMAGHDINREEVERAVRDVFGNDWTVYGVSGMSWWTVVTK